MAEPQNYVSGEAVEIGDVSEDAQEATKVRLGQIAPVLLGILGAVGLLAATVAIVSVTLAQQRREGHPALAELLANSRRWERDMRHHRGALERLGRALAHEGRELQAHRRHALISLMHP
jgi:septal ring factor EnvC (AmiA/AmiB activator)